MQKSYKTSPKNILDEIKKRRQTINIIQSEYNLPQKIKSPKTEKKQSYFIKDLKSQQRYEKHSKIMYTEGKKSQRTNSLAPYETDLTPKKLLYYHIDSSQPKQRPIRKIHSISLVDTPKKLHLKKKTEEHLFTVKQEQNKDGCKKVSSSYKLNPKNYTKPLRIESNSRVHDSMEQQNTTPSNHMKSSKKIYSKNSENYDIYYNESCHNNNNSSSQLRSSKKVVKLQQNNSSIALEKQQQKQSSRTLRITRNSRSSNHDHQQQDVHFNHQTNQKNSSNLYSNNNDKTKNNSSKNNTKSQKGMKSPRVEEFNVEVEGSSQGEKKYEKMFFKCSLVLKKYNCELEKLRGENDSLRRENEYLRSTVSQRAL